MTTHHVLTIVEAIKTALGQIVTDGATAWSLTKVPRISTLSQSTLKLPVSPHLLVTFDDEEKVRKSSGGSVNYKEVNSRFVVIGRDLGDGVIAAAALMHDVEKALGRNRLLGGACWDSTVTGTSWTVPDEVKPRVEVEVHLLVRYRHDERDPSTTAP